VRRAAEGIDTVYHLASGVGMRRAVQQRDHAWDVSTTGTARVLDATGATPVVVFSSSAVYGLTQAVRAREDADLSEDDTRAYDGGGRGYSTGKLHLERLAADASRAGRAVLVVRPFNVVGPGQSGSYGMVLPRFLAAARAGEALVIHDDGAQARAFSEVHTFLTALDRLAAHPDAWAPGRNVFNIGAPTPTRILDLARLVVEHAACHTGRRAPLRFEPYADAFPGHTDVRVRVPDVTRLSALVGSLAWPSIGDIVRQLSEADAAQPVALP
jgi:UDP-glucose 4-epimerase